MVFSAQMSARTPNFPPRLINLWDITSPCWCVANSTRRGVTGDSRTSLLNLSIQAQSPRDRSMTVSRCVQRTVAQSSWKATCVYPSKEAAPKSETEGPQRRSVSVNCNGLQTALLSYSSAQPLLASLVDNFELFRTKFCCSRVPRSVQIWAVTASEFVFFSPWRQTSKFDHASWGSHTSQQSWWQNNTACCVNFPEKWWQADLLTSSLCCDMHSSCSLVNKRVNVNTPKKGFLRSKPTQAHGTHDTKGPLTCSHARAKLISAQACNGHFPGAVGGDRGYVLALQWFLSSDKQRQHQPRNTLHARHAHFNSRTR